jgi:hypothetical protein
MIFLIDVGVVLVAASALLAFLRYHDRALSRHDQHNEHRRRCTDE